MDRVSHCQRSSSSTGRKIGGVAVGILLERLPCRFMERCLILIFFYVWVSVAVSSESSVINIQTNNNTRPSKQCVQWSSLTSRDEAQQQDPYLQARRVSQSFELKHLEVCQNPSRSSGRHNSPSHIPRSHLHPHGRQQDLKTEM